MLASQVEDTPDDIGPYYPCQIDDVVLVSQTLLRCFRGQSVPHVVNSIIDHAEYWLRLSASKREAREVTGYRRAWPFTATEQNPCRTAYLQTPPIHKHGQHLPLAIKRVKIWITGKDQGWCTVNDDGSWTWWVVVRQSLEGRMGSASLHESAPELPDSWAEGPELVRNEQAGNDYKTYLIDASAGDGSELAKWLASLKPMDVVGIRPKARFGGWMCNTLAARIEVYTAEYAL